MLLDKAGFGFHLLESLVARHTQPRRPLPAFHYRQYSFGVCVGGGQTGNISRGNVPYRRFGLEPLKPGVHHVKLFIP
jgi:hypothetical protein